MSSWPRDILPAHSSPFRMPGALQGVSQSGKRKKRSTGQIGRLWSETYPNFKMSSDAGRKLIATINDFWRNGTTFDIEHYDYLTHSGGGTGTARVNGASQTGSSLITDGWTGSNPVLKAGNIIKLASLNQVLDILADAPNLSGGGTTLTINPPIFAGGSAPDNDIITYTGVRLQATIAEMPDIPDHGPDYILSGLTILFGEMV